MIFTSRISSRGNRIGPVRLCVCVSVSTLATEPLDLRTQYDILIWPEHAQKGLWGEGTLQHGSREVRQCSGVFISIIMRYYDKTYLFALLQVV